MNSSFVRQVREEEWRSSTCVRLRCSHFTVPERCVGLMLSTHILRLWWSSQWLLMLSAHFVLHKLHTWASHTVMELSTHTLCCCFLFLRLLAFLSGKYVRRRKDECKIIWWRLRMDVISISMRQNAESCLGDRVSVCDFEESLHSFFFFFSRPKWKDVTIQVIATCPQSGCSCGPQISRLIREHMKVLLLLNHTH